MSEAANGSDAVVKFTEVQKGYDGETLVDKTLQRMMRVQVHFERGVGLFCDEYPCLHRLG